MIDPDRQCAAFLNWFSRRGGAWDEAIDVWLASKDFDDLSAERIRRAVAEEMRAREAMYTDALDYLTPEAS